MEAVSNDEQVAEQILDRPEENLHPRRRMSEYNAVVEMLSVVADRVSELISLTAAINGGTPREIPHAPRPETALERVKDRRRRDKHKAIVARMLPHKQNQ